NHSATCPGYWRTNAASERQRFYQTGRTSVLSNMPKHSADRTSQLFLGASDDAVAVQHKQKRPQPCDLRCEQLAALWRGCGRGFLRIPATPRVLILLMGAAKVRRWRLVTHA